MSILKMISVSGSLSQITKLWVNLNSGVLKCKAVIPSAVMGGTICSVQFGCSGLYGGLVTVSNILVSRIL